jgi:hypothetical protein
MFDVRAIGLFGTIRGLTSSAVRGKTEIYPVSAGSSAMSGVT